MVRITPTGIEEVEKSRPHNLLSSFSEDEIIQFASFLRRAIAEIDERREELEGAPDGEAPAGPSGGE